MTIIEYKLHASPDGMKAPNFVTDGGWWINEDDNTFIGIVPDGAEYYLPDTITTYTLAELQERQIAIHAKYPVKKPLEGTAGVDMTDEEVNQAVADWVTERTE